MRRHRKGCSSCTGSGGFSLDLIPLFQTGRDDLRIHLDSGIPGTLGRIGLACSISGGADELSEILKKLYDQPMPPAIELEVK